MGTTQTSTSTVLYSVAEGVATITLSRPDRLNAWNRAMAPDFRSAVEEAADDRVVRAVVLTGAGRAFCAGADFDLLGAVTSGEDVISDEGLVLPTILLSIPKPVIGAINGPTAGLGLVIALCCDIRFAAAGAKLTSAFARRGLIAEYGVSWLLPRLAGMANALDVLLSARTFLAEEGERMGLINRVVPGEDLLETATAYARDLAANCSPRAMKIIKDEVYRHLQTDLKTAVGESLELMYEAAHAPDAKEGLTSFLEKRAPQFPPLAE
jgi:enoyl-CoA hydratase/carnithine racemase